MSWFFGKKKHHHDSPPDSPAPEPTNPEDFIFIERRNQPADPDSDNKTPSLYPSLSNITPYPAAPLLPAAVPKQNSQDCSDLNCIPFKLCRELEMSTNDDMVIDQLRLDEILSFITRVNVESYDYKFSLERSVIAEMESQNEG